MGIKDRIGYHLYEGSLQKPARVIGKYALRKGLLGKNNAYRALYLLFKEGKVTPEELEHYSKVFEHNLMSKKIFLMHIPKTAGTSLRTTLEEAIGVPAITPYQNESKFSAIHWDKFSFWPLLSGHVHIDYFPKTHIGITAFRESRSRVLSEYRQIERHAHLGKREIIQFFPITTNDDGRIPWEQFRKYDLLHTFYWFFTAGHRDDWQSFIATAPSSEIYASIESGLKRIQTAAWSHDSDALESAASAILEGAVTMKRVNVFPQNEVDVIQLTHDDLQILNECTNLDDLVIDVASTLGLVPKLSQSEKDALFERDVERLGFRLP